MEFNFSPVRIAILAALVGGYWAIGGFSLVGSDLPGMSRSAMNCVGLFLGGAGLATIVDHYVGTMERTNLRVLYVLLGIALMTAGVLWIEALKQSAAER